MGIENVHYPHTKIAKTAKHISDSLWVAQLLF